MDFGPGQMYKKKILILVSRLEMKSKIHKYIIHFLEGTLGTQVKRNSWTLFHFLTSAPDNIFPE